MQRKKFLVIIIVAIIVIGAAAVMYGMTVSKPTIPTLTSTPTPTTTPITLHMGYQPSTHQIAFMVAMEKGWWKDELAKYGVTNVVDHVFPSGPPEMQAMMGGDLDIAYVGATPPLSAIDQGLDAKIAAAVQVNGSALVLAKDIPYTEPEDLKGLTVATFPPGSIQDTVLKKWLMDNGLKPDVDVVFKPMGSGEALTALKTGAVDGVFLPAPSPTIAEIRGYGKIVVRSGEMWPNHACCVLLVNGKLLREHPDLMEEIVRIHLKATDYVNSHPDETVEIYCRKVEGSVLSEIMQSIETWDGAWIFNPHIIIESTLEYAKVHYELGYTKKLLTEKDIFDTSIYDKVK